MKRQLLFFFFLLFGTVVAIGQTSLEGRVKDATTGEPVIFGNVALFQNGVLKTGIETDENGFFNFANIDPGTYMLEITYVGYQTQRVNGVLVLQGKINTANVKLDQGVTLNEVVVTDYAVPLIQKDNTSQGKIMTSEEIRNSPLKSIASIATTTAGLTSTGGELNVRGSRGNATNIYVDGIRVINSSAGNIIPQSEVDQMQVVTGGLEASYGDVTGGVISITTKGPSSRFSGGVELETSKFLDPYNRSEINANISGPIAKNKKGESMLGFRLSGRYLYNYDDNPSYIGVYRMPESVIRELEQNPLTVINNVAKPSAEFLNNSDVDRLDARPNERAQAIDFNGKIDARVNQAIDLSLSGGYRNTKNKFAIGGQTFNWINNPEALDDGIRTSLRFRHRLGSNYNGGGEESKKKSPIQNAVYILQGGFEKTSGVREDIRHGQNPFRYGHVGTFNYSEVPVGGEVPSATGDSTEYKQAGWQQRIDENNPFTPSIYNPALGAFNANTFTGFSLDTLDTYPAQNGFLSSSYSTVWRFQNNVGSVYNTMGKYESNVYTGGATFSFDILPGGSEKGKHSLQFGLLYEQRTNRSWTLAPFGLWTIARQQANAHFNGVDYDNPTGNTFIDPTTGLLLEEYGRLVNDNPDLKFYKAVRTLTGTPLQQFIDVDAINPDDLRLDMFAANELTDQGILNYYGYDYLGEKKLGSDVSFNDFFSKRNPDGTRAFEVAPITPIYSSAYLQDKFSYKDIIFRLGLRVDRYDANTKVLKDIYSLYEVQSAKDFYAEFPDENRPAAVSDDYKVYVNGDGSSTVKAFRQGDNWYYNSGAPANDGNVIFGGEVIYPKFYNNRVNNIQNDQFDPDNSFEDYTPQINWMPRIAISFPISDDANFFAHYDVLSQRPPDNNNVTALNYYRFFEATPESNPNLLPERTIDYEVGYQQRISNSSALKLSAYYKELRNMIQSREVLYVPTISKYTTYGNIDFGTVKGFQISYDMRRTGNLTLNANYTIQFADGTGSDANSQRGLTTRGNIRTLFPLNFDERHAFKLVADFRYGNGKRYNGPRWFGVDFLSDFGVNLNSSVVSGRPYTRTKTPVQFGGSQFDGAINGSRLPWNFNMDLRVDKNISLSKPGARNPINLNVYVRVLNLLNTKNILGVYTASGSADDDGFLATANGQNAVATANSSDQDLTDAGWNSATYIDQYTWSMANPGFYSGPRRIFLGAIVEF